MYTCALLPLLLFTVTVTFALPHPQLSCPVASLCTPPVPYSSPLYDDWARDQLRQWTDAHNKHEQNAHSRSQDAPATAVVAHDQDEWAGVYYCEDYAWGGACKHAITPIGGAPEDCSIIDGAATSIGPDLGFYCIFYTNAYCAPLASDGSDSLALTYPGTDNLGFTDKGDFNDRLLSYHCFNNDQITLEPELGTPPNATTATRQKLSDE